MKPGNLRDGTKFDGSFVKCCTVLGLEQLSLGGSYIWE